MRLEQEAGGGIGREQALGVAQQPGTIGLVCGFRDLLVERVEGVRPVAGVIIVLGVFHEVERLNMGDNGEIVVLRTGGVENPR